MARLQRLGKSTSKAEVLNVSPQGLWLLVNEREYFLPYKNFPWFQKARLSEILNLKFLSGYHLHWPELDVDLEVKSLENLEQYPLVYK
ncbi:MAG: DUF2442 domain-containing protein [Deltaproteobacteria bacterium]|nr:DUF2442 domain-containing protein [Deltaproteobacteria bacterium]